VGDGPYPQAGDRCDGMGDAREAAGKRGGRARQSQQTQGRQSWAAGSRQHAVTDLGLEGLHALAQPRDDGLQGGGWVGGGRLDAAGIRLPMYGRGGLVALGSAAIVAEGAMQHAGGPQRWRPGHNWEAGST
jgi:hypothetical protein